MWSIIQLFANSTSIGTENKTFSHSKKDICLVTGAAGFIGHFVARRLLEKGYRVIGIDNLNDYYEVTLKQARLALLEPFERFVFARVDISDEESVEQIFKENQPSIVINLAAQAGVRYSIVHPESYVTSNLIGLFNILEACRRYPVDHLLYASSSSVYGANRKIPFKESDFVDNPVSLYAATKKSNELMAHAYSHLYGIPATGLRFFTVYGPMGRPDMAYFKFTRTYFLGKPIKIFNNGDFENDLCRDFTYIDDVVIAMEKLLDKIPDGKAPHKIYNVGNNKPVRLMKFVETLERCLSRATGKEIIFKKIFEPAKPGDVPTTFASIDLLNEAIGFRPRTSIEEGLQKFANWYVEFYDVQ